MVASQFTAYGFKKKHNNIYSLLLVTALVAAITLVILLVVDKLGDYEKAKYISLAVMLVFTPLAVRYYYKKRFKITLVTNGNNLTLRVHDTSLPSPIVINMPPHRKIVAQWTLTKMGRQYPDMRTVYLTIFDSSNTPLVTFECILGAIYTIPPTFTYIDVSNPHAQSQLVFSPNLYTTGKLISLTEALYECLRQMGARP